MLVVSIGMNIVASVGIILVNKQIASGCMFHFLLTMLSLNFLTTACFTSVTAQLGWFEVKHLPTRDRWLVALLAMLTVLLNNASNEANSVGFYQITKIFIIPTGIAIERFNGVNRHYSHQVILSLIVTSFGVVVATVSDFEVNFRGSVLAVLSVLFTAQYQQWQHSKQHEHDVSATQITHSVNWPQSLLGFSSASILDVTCPSVKKALFLRSGGLLDYDMGLSPYLPVWILLCCALSVGMNISTYGLLGKTSPVTYQVINQVKTCLITILAYIFFDVEGPRKWVFIRFFGVAIAVSGAFTYGFLKTQEQAKAGETNGKKKS